MRFERRIRYWGEGGVHRPPGSPDYIKTDIKRKKTKRTKIVRKNLRLTIGTLEKDSCEWGPREGNNETARSVHVFCRRKIRVAASNRFCKEWRSSVGRLGCNYYDIVRKFSRVG